MRAFTGRELCGAARCRFQKPENLHDGSGRLSDIYHRPYSAVRFISEEKRYDGNARLG